LILDLGSNSQSSRIGCEQKSNSFWHGNDQAIYPLLPRRKHHREDASHATANGARSGAGEHAMA
jgi:hypothetical protein